ncbi:MAG: trypsin-like peptidase domain-containing protein [Candidatus Omnitrophica bacterium]|nr:trypsin-like peptidase domain-containing protein [Candidatus Omnitrophota bacterium]
MRTHLLVLGVCLWTAIAPPTAADTLRFKDGTKMRGTVIKRTPTEVIVQFEFGTMKFSPGDIVGVEDELEPEQQPETVHEEHSGTGADPAGLGAVASTDRGGASGLAPSQPGATGKTAETSDDGMTLSRARNAVAFIGVVYKDGNLGFGSGTVVTRKGAIVTNYHLVGNADRIAVVLPGDKPLKKTKSARTYDARILKSNPCYGLALIRIPTKTPDYLRLADDKRQRVGDSVRAIGSPEGSTTTVSEGVIRALRTAEELGLESSSGVPGCEHLSGRALGKVTWVQTDVAINAKNSGGPLLDAQSAVVGINAFSLQHVDPGNTGLNFAIHVKHVRDFIGSYVRE